MIGQSHPLWPQNIAGDVIVAVVDADTCDEHVDIVTVSSEG